MTPPFYFQSNGCEIDDRSHGMRQSVVLQRSRSPLHKQRNSDPKIIADQQGHGMRTHLDAYVQSGVAERKAEAAKLYADFAGVLNNRG